MCGRFQLAVELDKLLHRYGIINENIDYKPMQEIYPSNETVVVLNDNGLKLKNMKWGFDVTFTNKLLINARSETAHEKKTFRYSFFNRRCLIPASGFYEWKKEGNSKVKYQIAIKDSSIFSMAGIYDLFKDEKGNTYNAFTILTTEANKQIQTIHHRMPVIIEGSKENIWLNNELKDIKRLKDLTYTYSKEMIIGPVNKNNTQLNMFNNI